MRAGKQAVPLTIHPVPISAFGAMSYVVKSDDGHWLAVDAAPPADLARAAGGGSPDYLVLTHEHFDHIAGFQAPGAFADVVLVASETCGVRLGDPALNLSRYHPSSPPLSVRPPDIAVLAGGLSIGWCGHRVDFTAAPGHSPGGLLIRIAEHLFTGDTLLRHHRTVTRLPGGDRQALRLTLRHLFDHEPGNPIVWPGHGEAFRLSEASLAESLDGPGESQVVVT